MQRQCYAWIDGETGGWRLGYVVTFQGNGWLMQDYYDPMRLEWIASCIAKQYPAQPIEEPKR